MAFDLSKFRILYPTFASVSDEVVTVIAEQSACYVPIVCAGECGDQMLMLMVAHLLALRNAEAAGQSTRAVSSATIGNVSVSMVAPANGSDRSVWLFLTGYGTQYAALETKCLASSKAGIFFGGLPERRSFRKSGGRFR